MKRLIICLITLIMMFNVSGCTNTSSDVDNSNKEAGVNELEAIDGVYKITSVEGFMDIYNHLDGKFELLSDIDLSGATIKPIGSNSNPFKGSIKGNKHTISNFIIDGFDGDGYVGFFGKCSGDIEDLNVDNYRLVINGDEEAIGGFAGIINGKVSNCNFTNGILEYSGSLKDDVNIGSMFGVLDTSSKVTGTYINLDLKINIESGKVNIGGVAGIGKAGTIKDSEDNGRIIITDKNGTSNIGLFFGVCEDPTIIRTQFTGKTNKVNNELLSSYSGNETDNEFQDCYFRDNTYSDDLLDEESLRIRQICVDYMYEMGTIPWIPIDTLTYFCSDGNAYCTQVRVKGVTYHGLPYTHKSGSLERMKFCLNDDGTMKEFANINGYDGFDLYMGNDCSGAVNAAWSRVATGVVFGWTWDMLPSANAGCIEVGDYDGHQDEYTNQVFDRNGKEKITEAYTHLHIGDAVVTWRNEMRYEDQHANHAHMIVENCPLRDRDGNISTKYSYCISHGQGEDSITSNENATTWKLNRKQTYDEYLSTEYIPITIQEFINGKSEEPYAKCVDSKDDYFGLMTGKIESNYKILNVETKITSNGNEVADLIGWLGLVKYEDSETDFVNRQYNKTADLSEQAVQLQEIDLDNGKTYHAVVSVLLSTGDTIVVKDFDFKY